MDACSGKTAVPSSGCGHCKCLNGSLDWKERKSQEKKKKKEQQNQTNSNNKNRAPSCVPKVRVAAKGGQPVRQS